MYTLRAQGSGLRAHHSGVEITTVAEARKKGREDARTERNVPFEQAYFSEGVAGAGVYEAFVPEDRAEFDALQGESNRALGTNNLYQRGRTDYRGALHPDATEE